jgi:4'-phosphopantetheinyl transferase
MTQPLRHDTLAASGVALHFCLLDDDATIPLTKAAALLSPLEAARAARLRFDRDRARFIRGRGFLRRVLGDVTGLAPAALPLTTGAHGKPGLDLPAAPGFNLSHSGGLAVLALRAAGPVGIDLEACAPARDHTGLYDTTLAAAEAAQLRALPLALKARAFLACWTAKEAVMKLTGAGLALDPRDIRLRLETGVPRAVLSPAARLFAVPLPDHVCHIALPPAGPCPERHP